MPEFLRVQEGAIEAYLIEGDCDSAARATGYVLRSVGLRARQFNLLNPTGGGHVVVEIERRDGSAFLIDPQFGLAPRKGDRVLGFSEAQALQSSGAPPGDIWRSITNHPQYNTFYDTFDQMWGTPQGEPFEIKVTLDLDNMSHLRIGEHDGDGNDVSDELVKYGLSPYWSYLGHRFDRGWVRVMTFLQPTRVTFTTIGGDVDDGVVTSDRPPLSVSGNTIVYEYDSGETMRFHDSRAKINWLRFNSYQRVDSILFEDLD